ncbi:hypothetical protein PVIIG_05769 [Plasmodium vivax India VII]|uniref:Uncharacterized protein n=1 Tax=Plasmodium vivax India VII TaxID=1077284 RepID=A0A0J9S3L3_PLAVI|nr:hypothetical protein PVIIG_05769 [Plasmodium vivax India VII]
MKEKEKKKKLKEKDSEMQKPRDKDNEMQKPRDKDSEMQKPREKDNEFNKTYTRINQSKYFIHHELNTQTQMVHFWGHQDFQVILLKFSDLLNQHLFLVYLVGWELYFYFLRYSKF